MVARDDGRNGHQPRRQAASRLALGTVYATPGVLDQIDAQSIVAALRRHARGDWGDMCAEDKAANDQAWATEGRLVSSYRSREGIKFWVITEADRTHTTVLLPEEY